MKDWALEKGATHFTHWFQPLTGSTAEKHDSFYAPVGDGTALAAVHGQGADQGRAGRLELPHGRHPRHLRGPRLHRLGPHEPGVHPREPERRGPLHPDRLRVVDRRGPRHQDPAAALDGGAEQVGAAGAAAVRRHDDHARLHHDRARAGVLPDRRAVLLRAPRPRQHRAARSSAPSRPKGHELDDHYFGSIPERVLAYMLEVEHELAKLGVPIKTRHNEVAPGQYEVAPIFESSNVGTDHQQLCMQVMQQRGPALRPGVPAPREAVRRRQRLGQAQQLVDGHGRRAATCSSPATPRSDNLQFLFFRTAVIAAVYKHQELLRASIAGAGQDHRLGANEAPPAIISIFLGAELETVFDAIAVREAGHERGAGADGPGHPGAAGPAEGQRRPQPHQPVRLHRQQVRVPGPRLQPVAEPPQHRAQHDRRRVHRLALRGPRGGAGRPRRAAKTPRRGPLRGDRGQLQGRPGRSSSPATTTPRSGTRRPSKRGLLEPPLHARRPAGPDLRGHRRGVQQLRRALRARAALALRGDARAVRRRR